MSYSISFPLSLALMAGEFEWYELVLIYNSWLGFSNDLLAITT